MNPIWTILTGVVAASIVVFVICPWAFGSIPGENPIPALLLVGWPYFIHSYIAIVFNRDREASRAFLVFTVLSASFADFVFFRYFSEWHTARVAGHEVMNCGGPVVELGVPLIQAVAAVIMVFLLLPVRPSPSARDDEKKVRLDELA